MEQIVSSVKRTDWVLLLAALMLSGIGLLNLAGIPQHEGLLLKQTIFVVVGVVVFFAASTIDYRTLRSSGALVWSLWVVGVALLGGVALFGTTVRGAANWIILGPISIDPVEIVKVASLLALATYFARSHTSLVFLPRVLLSGFIIGIPVVFALLQPDLGSAVVLGALWFFMVVLLRTPAKTVLLLLLAAVLLVGIGWNTILHDYQKDRLTAFINPDADPLGAAYQTRQALIAAGSGGVFGQGFFAEDLSARLDLLPESANDFAFASLMEQGGLLTGLLILLLLGVLFVRVERVAHKATNNFSAIYAMGLLVLLTLGVLLHVGMNVGLLPVTGLPLPLVSYGGSHTLAMFAMLGLLQSIRLNQPELVGDEVKPLGDLSSFL